MLHGSINGLILDIGFIVIAALVILVNTKRGFVKSVFKTGRGIAATALALYFGPIIGDYFYNKFVYKFVYSWVFEKISLYINSTTEEVNIDGLIESLPLAVRQFVDIQMIKDQFGSLAHELVKSAESFSDTVSVPISNVLSNFTAYACVFLASMILLAIIGFLFNLLTKLPVIRGINTVLGFVTGVVVAVFTLSGLTYIITLAVGFWGSTSAIGLLASHSFMFEFFDKLHLFNLF